MGIPYDATLTITLNAEQVAGLECILQRNLNYCAEEGTHQALYHDWAQAIYDLLSEADRKAGRCGV